MPNEAWPSNNPPKRENLRPKIEYLSFADFQKEVRDFYDNPPEEYKNIEKGDISFWYRAVKKVDKHPHWPLNPHKYYAKEWKGFPELVGKREEYLPFTEFQSEIRKLYKGQKNIYEWYQEEKEKHKNWPARPWIVYKNKGWIGWPELVGKTNYRREGYLPLHLLKKQVMRVYKGETDIADFYNNEKPKHPHWPANPWYYYRNKGWKNWPDLIGKENRNWRYQAMKNSKT